jgi:hypothetical protein
VHLALLAEVCCALGDARRAVWLLDQLRPCEGRYLLCYGNMASLGPADRLLGRLAAVAGDPAEAGRLLDRALTLSRRMKAPVWTAHCLYDYAPASAPPMGPGPRRCWPRWPKSASGTAS